MMGWDAFLNQGSRKHDATAKGPRDLGCSAVPDLKQVMHVLLVRTTLPSSSSLTLHVTMIARGSTRPVAIRGLGVVTKLFLCFVDRNRT